MPPVKFISSGFVTKFNINVSKIKDKVLESHTKMVTKSKSALK